MNCNAVGCRCAANYECSNCKQAVYCSEECQALSWGVTHYCDSSGIHFNLQNSENCDRIKNPQLEIYESSSEPELIGISPTTPISVAKTTIQLGLAARDLSKLGRLVWARRKAGIPSDKQWLVEIGQQSGHKAFWSLIKSSGFVNVLKEVEKRSKQEINLVVAPSDSALDAYFRRITAGNQGVNEILKQAAARGPAADKKKDIVTELLSAHFFAFPFEGQTCVRLPGVDKNPITVCGPLTVTTLKVTNLKEFLNVKRVILRGPGSTEKLRPDAIKIVVGVAKRLAQRQKKRTFILLVNFAIVPSARSQQFKIVREGRRNVKVSKKTRREVSKIRKSRRARAGRINSELFAAELPELYFIDINVNE